MVQRDWPEQFYNTFEVLGTNVSQPGSAKSNRLCPVKAHLRVGRAGGAETEVQDSDQDSELQSLHCTSG